MLFSKTVAVVVPCYNEETQIRQVIKLMPEFVDLIIVVNDSSCDRTADVLIELQQESDPIKSERVIRPRPLQVSNNPYDQATNVLIELIEACADKFIKASILERDSCNLVIINHQINAGVGAAIASGYKYARDCGIDCAAVMAGDGQMDPAELESICMPVIDGRADYSKGNRLLHRSARHVIPSVRFYGNSILSILTKVASGYWRVSDTQTGYTAISLEALENIDLHKIYKSYGMPNDLLVKLNIGSFKVIEIRIKPVYQVGEQSKMKVWKVCLTVSALLVKLFFERMIKKYLIRDFHPLFVLYFGGIFGILIECLIAYKWINQYLLGNIMYGWLIIMVTIGIASFQSLVFAMWFDMQDNERLYAQ